MKIITILHADEGFETVEVEVDNPDALVIVNFIDGRMEIRNVNGVDVRDRDSGDLLTRILRQGGDCGGFGGSGDRPLE